jgi:hypothetical protein
MPFRRIPNSDAQRYCALQTCKLKSDATPAAERPISADNVTQLDAIFPQFKTALGARAADLSQQTASTDVASTALDVARQFISHFIQTLNMAIDRHTFRPSDRAFYQLDVNNGVVPPLASESDVLLWGQRVIDGEAARVAAGGMAIPFPSIAEVTTVFNDFKTKRDTQSHLSEAVDEDEEAIAALRPEVDALVVDLWDEIEFAFRRNAPSSLRNKAREWGVVYASRAGEQPDAPPAPEPPPPAP